MNPPSTAAVRRVVLASFIGTTIEWYDFYLYGTAAALVFDKLFFPNIDPLAGTMAAFATYAVGFFARPLGGIIFGHLGDRVGRRSMLVTTLMIMGVATFLIGLLPTYEQAGALAPVLLVTLRFVQGLGVGGEWGGAVLMAVEHGTAARRGFRASWVQAGVPAGLLLATIGFNLASALPEKEFLSWGWRVPFLLGIVLMGIGLFIRLAILESPVFLAMKAAQAALPANTTTTAPAQTPLLTALTQYPRGILLTCGARFGENASFYIFTVFILTYATKQLGFEKATILHGVLLGSVAQFVALPLFGALSDRCGRRPVYLGGAIFLVLFAFPFFWLVDTRSTAALGLAISIGLVGHSAMYGPQAAFFSELFGTNARYSGASLGYQLASPLAGGLAPLIATALLQWSGGKPWPVAVYLILMAAITIVSVWFAAETHRSDLSNPTAGAGEKI